MSFKNICMDSTELKTWFGSVSQFLGASKIASIYQEASFTIDLLLIAQCSISNLKFRTQGNFFSVPLPCNRSDSFKGSYIPPLIAFGGTPFYTHRNYRWDQRHESLGIQTGDHHSNCFFSCDNIQGITVVKMLEQLFKWTGIEKWKTPRKHCGILPKHLI